MANLYKAVGNVMLRRAPGLKNQVLKLIPNGASVHALEDEINGWIYAEYDGTVGYCMARFLKPISDMAYDDDNIGAAIETAFANVQSALDELKALITSAL